MSGAVWFLLGGLAGLEPSTTPGDDQIPDTGGGVTPEDIVLQALARAMEFSDRVPTTRAVLYRRIGVRQQHLVSLANREAPDYFGVAVDAPLTNGTLSLATITNNLAEIEAVHRLEIAEAGTSSYSVGDEVHIVSSQDVEVEFPPRVTLRTFVIRQVGNDLAGVNSLRVYYARRPALLGPADGKTPLVLPEAFQELLVVDLARELAKKALRIDPDIRQAHIALLDAEEEELLAAYLAHVRGFAATESRFDAPLYGGSLLEAGGA